MGPTNRELEVILKLKDELSKGLAIVQEKIGTFVKNLRGFSSNMKQMGREIAQVGLTMTYLGAAITGPLLLAFRSAAKDSWQISYEMSRLKNVTQDFYKTIAEALIPIVHNFTGFLRNLDKVLKSMPPTQRDAIVQSVFLAGVFLTLSGLAITLAGRLIRLVGIMGDLTAKLLLFGAVHPVLLTTAAAVIAITLAFIRWREIAIPFLNNLELLFRMVYTGAIKLSQWVMWSIEKMLAALDMVAQKLKILPGWLGGEAFRNAARDIPKMRDALQQMIRAVDMEIKNMEGGMSKIFGTGEGQWAEEYNKFQQMLGSIQDLFKSFGKISKDSLEDFKSMWSEGWNEAMVIFNNTGAQLKQSAKNIANAMHQGFSDFFFDAFTGQLKSMKDYFVAFGQVILRQLADMIASWIMSLIFQDKTIQNVYKEIVAVAALTKAYIALGWAKVFAGVAGAAAGGGGASSGGGGGGSSGGGGGGSATVHQGGFLQRAHLGLSLLRAHLGLGPDEVQVTALTGEGMLSRMGMRTIGGPGVLSRLNRGETVFQPSLTIQPTLIIKAYDYTDIANHEDEIKGLIANSITNNGIIRQLSRRYCR